MAGTGHVLILNGPNLNMLGLREPATYGTQSLAAIDEQCRLAGDRLGLTVACRQSNYEGELVTWIQEARGRYDAVILNAGAYTHTSVALLDAIRAAEVPVIEVHLSNPQAREPYRHWSYVAQAAQATIAGLGPYGYVLALDAIRHRLLG